jgi:hypothetical protein
VTVFNDILVASQIEEATIDQLVKWLPTYLREIEGQLEITVGSTPVPVHFSNRNSLDMLAGEKFPKVIVIAPGLDGAPEANGSGVYSARWQLGIGSIIAANSEPLANMQSKIYAAACRAIMLNYQSLGGLALAISWVDEQYEDLPVPNQNMLLKSAVVYFSVDCQNVATKWSGPQNPDEDPYAYGIVEHVIIDIEKLPIEVEA